MFHDGVFRGGSVIVDGSSTASGQFFGAPAFNANRQTNLQMRVYGGLFEGGTVSSASSPGVIIDRAPAFTLNNAYGGEIDLYGGTFVGGISMRGLTNLTVHGHELVLEPSLDGILPGGPRDFTISGTYLNGAPFSHSIHIDPENLAAIDRGPDFLTIRQLVPEPGGVVVAAFGIVLAAQRWRRQVVR